MARAAKPGENMPDPIPSPEDNSGVDPLPPSGGLDMELLRPAAEELGLNPDNMNEDDWAFVNVFMEGQLDSKPPAVPGDILPPDAPDPAEGTPTEADAGLVGTAPTGDGSEASEGTTGDGGVPSDEPTFVQPPTGAPVYEIPSPFLPQQQEPEPAAEDDQPLPMVMLPNGQVVTYEQAQAFAAQAAEQPAPEAPVNPWDQSDEYIDPRAQQDITKLNDRISSFEQQQYALAEQQRQQYEQSLELAINEARDGWGAARQLTNDQLDSVMNSAETLGLFGLYAEHFPGDPRRVVGTALEAAYRMSDDYIEQEVEARLAKEREHIAEIDRKRNAGAGLGGSSASVSRTPPAPSSRAEADKAMVAEIEQALGR